MKSSPLTFVSITAPPVGHTPNTAGLPFLPHSSRTKLYCNVLPLIGAKVVPSRNRSQVPPVLVPKPAASRRVTEERLATEDVLNIATFRSSSMSDDSVTLPAAAAVPP